MRLILTAVLLTATASAQNWVGTWATSPVASPNKQGAYTTDSTLREVVHVSLGGDRVRVTFTNELGTDPLAIGAASLAEPVGPTGPVKLTFGGQPGIVIPPGAVAVSDAVAFPLAPLSDISVNIFLPAQKLDSITRHGFANTTSFQVVGDQTAAGALTSPSTFLHWDFLKSVEVDAPGASAIVAFGDSITDGAKSTLDKHVDWPSNLAARLHANKATAKVAVLNEGIGGNRLLHDGTGPNALARFDRDVLSQSGVRAVILLEGINDIGSPAAHNGADFVSADQLIVAMKQLVTRAHAHGLRILGATLTPYLGAGYASPSGEAIRQAVNAFIRTPGSFDGIIDFDKATQDPADPTHFAAFADSGDHLHPKDAGYKAMSDAIELKLLTH